MSRIVRVALALALIPTALPAALAAQGPGRVPTVDELLGLRSVGTARISPDGRRVAYTQTETDLAKDAFVTHVWVTPQGEGEPYRLTRGDKSAANPRWSPDGRWLAFTSTREGDRSQIFLIRPDGGEALQLTKAETAVQGFEWSPDGRQIAFVAPEAPTPAMKQRREALGEFDVVRRDYAHTHLFTVDVEAGMREPQVPAARTKGRDFSVSSFAWSPDGARIAFAATLNPDLVQGATADLYVLGVADDAVRRIVDQPGPDNGPVWSPDGRRIAFSSYMGAKDYFARNARIAVVAAEGGTPVSLSDAFDENPGVVEWRTEGIYFAGLAKTASHLWRLDPESRRIERVTGPDDAMLGGFSLSRDGSRMALLTSGPTTLTEVAVTEVARFAPQPVTRMTEQTRGLTLGTRELVRWKSRDGAEIEGVLIKPADFDPARRYPLLCIIHGGPTGIDRPALLSGDTRYYPSDIWVGRGALVLKVNYRGSAGYGEKFRRLNYRNLGVGDAWDVISGVDHLVARGSVDPKKVAVMGWSQGGYISAFLTASSTKFAAVSVGAGISNWATYYYNTDITPFTINYLGADPVKDPEIYRKTSPMSYVAGARTPTLIQHGELDRRVPIANAYELRQALEDRGVPVEMVVYKGYGHGITRPKSMRAVMHHNLQWFNHYIWGDAKPDLTAPIPAGAAAAPVKAAAQQP